MSALTLEELKASLDIPLIVTSEEFDFYWKGVRFLERLSSISPQILEYCNKEVILELLAEDNMFLNAILHQSLKNIKSYLEESGKNYRLGIYLAKDVEIRDWKRITILVNIEYENVEEKMLLWEAIEGRITDVINVFKREHEDSVTKINRVNVIISTSVQRFQE